jgi:hypothetical protein
MWLDLFTIAWAFLITFLDAVYMSPYDSRWDTYTINGYHLWLLAVSFLPFIVIGLWTLASPKKRGQFYQDNGQKWGILLDAFMRGLFVTLVDDTTYGLFKYSLGLWSIIELIEWLRIQFCLTCDWFWWWADFYFFRIAVTPQLMAFTILLRAGTLMYYAVYRLAVSLNK